MDNDTLRDKILATVVRKSTLKQEVFDASFAVMNELKETLFEMAAEMDEQLDGRLDKRVRIEYRDRGKFEAQVQVADDQLIFRMHTDTFRFEHSHDVWKTPYVAANADNAYCGVVNIYNFLSDSFKYNRNGDEGYLIGRLFINRERSFFAEGKGLPFGVQSFGQKPIDRESLMAVLEAAIDYSLNFDLLMPPYEAEQRVTVDQFNTRMDNSKFTTGKRLDYPIDAE